MKRRIRMGMVGGGPGAFIGAIHRAAARLDGLIELVCGAFSSDPERSREMSRELFLPPARCYSSYVEMFAAERALPEGERMDFVSIVTPNHLHHPVARAALGAGFHVVCDKPMTRTLDEARDLVQAVDASGLVFALTHNYTGYPMVKEARQRVSAGGLGNVRKVVVEYPQGWLSTPLEATGQKQAAWRTDPALAGPGGSLGDIGTHAENLVEYVTGLSIESLCAERTTFVEGRRLDDDVGVLLRFLGGARGVLHASQVSVGEENALALKVYGDAGGLEWRQEEPNTLVLRWPDRPRQVLRAGIENAALFAATRAALRLPSGHPEGFIEAFANIYRAFALTLAEAAAPDFPTVRDGERGMRFIEKVVESARDERKWIPFQDAR